MLQQLEFKLSVEKQYKEGIEKMVNLYQMEGDRRSKADAEGKRMESAQKIQLLTKSRKRYSDMHIDFEEEAGDDESMNMANLRRPLSGNLHISCLGIKDVDHVTTARPLKSPETMITVKVEDQTRAKTKLSRTGRWTEEFDISVDKANEIELTVYDKIGDQSIPVGLMWLRISDIAEAMRRRKVEQELNQAGWVSASKVQSNSHGGNNGNSGGNHNGILGGRDGNQKAGSKGHSGNNNSQSLSSPSITIDSWFVLEPAGQIHLSLGFEKTSKGTKRPYDGVGGLGRQGAIRQKKEEIHEMHGHQFVQQQFYNIMKCALCGDFLKYAGGYQCLDCKYTCHKKCYPKVVTKCISRASNEADPDEEKLNHRIPHRFEPTTNMSANWCCHCGYILPLGKKNVRKCTECGSTCHAECVHLVPDFCGMSMEVANKILSEIKSAKSARKAAAGGISAKPPVIKISDLSSSVQQPMSPTSAYNYGSTAPVSQQRVTPGSTEGAYRPGTIQQQQQYVPQEYHQQQPQDVQIQQQQFKQQQLQQQQLHQQYHQQQQQQPQQPQHQYQNQYGSPSSKIPYPPQERVSPVSTQPHPNRVPVKRKEVNPSFSPSVTNSPSSSSPYTQKSLPAESGVPHGSSIAETQKPSLGSSIEFGASGSSSVHQAPKIESAFTSPKLELQHPVSTPTHSPSSSQTTDHDTVAIRDQVNHQRQSPTPAVLPSNTQLSSTARQSVQMSPSQASPRKSRRKVGLDDFSFLAVLGKGNFGKVMLAEARTTKTLYAIKVLKKDFIIENDEVESTRSEKSVFLIASREQHPFLLSLNSCFQTENRVYFVMEYVSGGDLMWHIQQEPFTPRRAQFYAAEVLLGLKYFHENGVIYRDLKLDNILLTLDGHVKIADYGLCKEDMGYGNTTGTFCGTPEFMAPEILLEQKYGRGVDWWAFGVLIYQMLLGQSPFRGDDDDEVFDAILLDEPLYPIHMPRDSVAILQGLLTREPEKRLGSGPTDANEIMSHAYFRNINFDDIYHCRVPPPYVPQIDSPTDVKNFDQEFTKEIPTLTPVTKTLTPAMQEQFRGFSYLNGDAAI